MNFLSFAVAVVAAYFRVEAATRPIDKKETRARLAGMFKAANALGIGYTETHVEMVFLDSLREVIGTLGDRPVWKAIDNSAQREWDAELAKSYAAKLENL